MMKRIAALLICAALIAGCNAASSQTEPASSSQPAQSSQQEQKQYTYQNPDPDMVMITSPGGDITYKDYRLYIDIGEKLSRYTARQQMAICHTLEKDFANMGITINEEEFKQVSEEQMLTITAYSPAIMQELKDIAEIAGMTEEEVIAAMRMGFRSDYLITQLGNYFQGIAAEEFVEPAEGYTLPENAAQLSAEEVNAYKEYQKQQLIYEAAMQKMGEYSQNYDSRLTFDNEDALATLDGEVIPYTDEAKNYIDYAGIAARIDSIDFIHAGEFALRELNRLGKEIDEAAVAENTKMYIESMVANSETMESMAEFCKDFGATTDDYFKALERPMMVEEAGNRYYEMVADEYYEMLDNTPKDEFKYNTPDEYFVECMAKLLEGSEVVNIMGK